MKWPSKAENGNLGVLTHQSTYLPNEVEEDVEDGIKAQQADYHFYLIINFTGLTLNPFGLSSRVEQPYSMSTEQNEGKDFEGIISRGHLSPGNSRKISSPILGTRPQACISTVALDLL